MSNPAATDFFTVFPVNQYVHYGIAAHPQDFSRKFHGHAAKVITEIIVFIAYDTAVLNICDNSVKYILLGNKSTAL